MIREAGIRTQDGRSETMYDMPRPTTDALERFVKELEFGARVSTLTETRVMLISQYMGTEDATSFEGSRENMKILHELATVHAFVSQSAEVKEALLTRIRPTTTGPCSFFELELLAMDMGRNFTKLALLALIGGGDTKLVSVIKKKKTADLIAVLQLMETGLSREEAVALAE